KGLPGTTHGAFPSRRWCRVRPCRCLAGPSSCCNASLTRRWSESTLSWVNDRQIALDCRAILFFPRRQLERLPQRGERLIHGESGRHRSCLVQDPSRLAEVDRTEILPVQHFGNRISSSDQLLPELPLFVLTGNGQGNVVHRAQPVACWSSVTAIPQLQGVTRQIAIHRHPHHTFRFVYYLEAEQLPGKAHARSRGRYRKGHTIETSDGHVGGEAVPGPRCSGIVSRLGQAHPKS